MHQLQAAGTRRGEADRQLARTVGDRIEVAIAKCCIIVDQQRRALPGSHPRCDQAVGRVTGVPAAVEDYRELTGPCVVGVLQKLLEDAEPGRVGLQDIVQPGGQVLLLVEAAPLFR